MLKKFTIIFAAVVGVTSKTIAVEDLPVFQNLHSMLSNTAEKMDVRIQNMMFIENDLDGGMKKLQWLQDSEFVGNAKQGIAIAEEAMDKVKGAVDYISSATDEAADVKRVEEVLGFIREKKVLLVKYSGQKLTNSIMDLNRSANKMYGSMQKVKSMAFLVREKAIDIKDWMESFDELGNKVDSDVKDTWKVVLKDWQDTLGVAKKGTEECRNELKDAIAQVLDMKSTVEGMSAETELKANEHMDQMEAERQAAQDAYDDAPNCNWVSAIFTLGIDCIVKAAAKRKADRTVKLVAQKQKELKATLIPLIAKIRTIEDVASVLLAAGYEKLEAVEDFLDALTDAEGYFNNGGTLFTKPARRKHIKKLDTLITACDTMLVHAMTKMEVFKAVITGGKDFDKEKASINGNQFEDDAAKEAEDWKNEMLRQKQQAGKLMLQNLVISRGVLNKNMDDISVFLM